MQAIHRQWKIFLLLLFLWPGSLSAQGIFSKDRKYEGVGLSILPIVYRTPETGWAFGASAALYGRLSEKKKLYLAYLRPEFIYTQNRQWIARAPWLLYLGNRWITRGEVGYYNYNYLFFGIGNDQDPDFVEEYEFEHPRVRTEVYRMVRGNTFIGLTYAYDNITMNRVDGDGQLATGEISGYDGGEFLA